MEIAQNTTRKLSKFEKALRKDCRRLSHEHNHSETEQTSDFCSIKGRRVERKLKKKNTYSRTTCSYPCLIGLALKIALIGHVFIKKIFKFVCTHYFPYFRNSTEIIILETKHVISDERRGTHRRG